MGSSSLSDLRDHLWGRRVLLICVTISVLLGVPTAHGLNVLHVALAGSFTLTLTPSFHLTRKAVQKEERAPISSDAMKETIMFQPISNALQQNYN